MCKWIFLQTMFEILRANEHSETILMFEDETTYVSEFFESHFWLVNIGELLR